MPQRVAARSAAAGSMRMARWRQVRKLEQPGDISCLELEFDFVNRIAQDRRSILGAHLAGVDAQQRHRAVG